MPWPRPSSACSKPRSSSGWGLGAASRRSKWRLSTGSTGSTADACSDRSETSLPLKPKRVTIPKSRHPPWRRDSSNTASGKPGAVHLDGVGILPGVFQAAVDPRTGLGPHEGDGVVDRRLGDAGVDRRLDDLE